METGELPPHPRAVFLEQGFTGYPETLTEREKELLAEAKERVPPREARALQFRGEQLDAMYCRFLRARKFDVDAACSMQRAALDWRRRFGVDKLRCMTAEEVLGCSEAVIHRYYPQYLLGFDRRGRPITMRLAGKLDVKSLLRHVDIETFVRYYVWQHEHSVEMMSDVAVLAGHSNFRFCAIINMDGFGWSTFTSEVRDVTQRLSSIMSDYYPETMGKGFLINSPWVFTAIWRIASALLDEVTKSRTQILGGSFHKEVFQDVPRDIVPTELGGTRRDLSMDPRKWDEQVFPYLIEHLPAGKDLIASAGPERVERMLRLRHASAKAAADAAGVPWRGPRPGEMRLPSMEVERPLSQPHDPSNDGREQRGKGGPQPAPAPAPVGEPSRRSRSERGRKGRQGGSGPEEEQGNGQRPRQTHTSGGESGRDPQPASDPVAQAQPAARPALDAGAGGDNDAAAAGPAQGASGSGSAVAAAESDVGSQSSHLSGADENEGGDGGDARGWDRPPEVSLGASSHPQPERAESEADSVGAAADEGDRRRGEDRDSPGHRRARSSASQPRRGREPQDGAQGEERGEGRCGRGHRRRRKHRGKSSRRASGGGQRGGEEEEDAAPAWEKGRWEEVQRREFRRRFRNPGLVRLAPGVYGRSSKVDIPPQTEHHRTVMVREGQVLEWSFSTKPYDIAFSVLLNSAVKRRYRRLPAHKVTQGGCLPVTESGTCVLVWSNRYSWLTGKQLFFTVRCIDASAVAEHASESTHRALQQAAQEEGEEGAAARAIAASANAVLDPDQRSGAAPQKRYCATQ